MKLTLYRLATTLGAPLIRLYLWRRMRRGKEDSTRFCERLGRASRSRPSGKLMWIHAASVGESLSALPVIARLRRERNDWSILLTTGTVTSARLMGERLPEGVIHHYIPVDRIAYVRRFLDHWQPDFALWMESELWPNLVIETRARAIPMMILNGRISSRSWERWQKNKALIGQLLGAFTLVMAQSERDGERFRELGAQDVHAPGNIKFAAEALPADKDDLRRLRTLTQGRPLWLAASTHAGEEALCGRIHSTLREKIPGVLSIIAPRHPERGAQVAAELGAMGLHVARRSTGQMPTSETDIYLIDTLGEMGALYRLSGIAFMGKSMPSKATKSGGGQNPIEPALLDCALIWGPDMSNFEGICEKLLNAHAALQADDEIDLGRQIEHLLNNDDVRTRMAARARAIATAETGVLERVLDALAPYLKAEEKGGTDARA